MQLYKMTEELQKLKDDKEALISRNDFDADAIKDTLDSIDSEIDAIEEDWNSKVDSILGWIADNKNTIAGIDQIIASRQKEKKALTKLNDDLIAYLKNQLSVRNEKKLTTDNFKVTVTNSKAKVVIDDEDQLPSEYFKVKIQKAINKNKIFDELRNGNTITGTHLSNTTSLRITQ